MPVTRSKLITSCAGRRVRPARTRREANHERQKLLDSVSLSELQTMREAGMSNNEIAESLDVSYRSVWKHLGPDETRHKRARHAYDNPPVIRKELGKEEPHEAALCVQNRVITLHGVIGAYEIDCKNRNIVVTIDRQAEESEEIHMSIDNIGDYIEKSQAHIDRAQTFIKELEAIQRKAGEWQTLLEVW